MPHPPSGRPSGAPAVVATLTLLAVVARPVGAQQTIINVPSVDQTPARRVFFLHESQVRGWEGERFWQTTNFLTYGVTRRFEAALTTYNVGRPFRRTAAVGLGWKTAQPLAEVAPALAPRLGAWEPTVGAGQMAPLSMRGGGLGLWNWAQGSVRLPKLGTRLMGGVSNGPPVLFGEWTTHAIASYEQPLAPLGRRLGGRLGTAIGHMTLLGEWWSGRHENGDFVPGINYHTKSIVVIVGYKLSNKPGTRGDGLIFEIGRTF